MSLIKILIDRLIQLLIHSVSAEYNGDAVRSIFAATGRILYRLSLPDSIKPADSRILSASSVSRLNGLFSASPFRIER